MELTIPFKGLSAGKHSFKFDIDEKFFESFDLLDVKKGNAVVSVEMMKESALMDLHFLINGTFEIQCDRCLGKYKQQSEDEFRLVVKFGETYDEESDEVIVIPQTESRIDLQQYIYEYLNLMLPIKKTHPNLDDCDPEMIEKINTHSKQEIDPRWDALKKLNLK